MGLYVNAPYQWALDSGRDSVLLMGGDLSAGTQTYLPTGSRITVAAVDGLDMPDLDSVVENYTNNDGATTTALYHGPRTIAITGRIYTTPGNYFADTTYLRSFFTSMRRTGVEEAVFEFQYPGSNAMMVSCKPQSLRYATTNTETAVGIVDFLGTLVCGDPRIYASTLTDNPDGLTLSAGGSLYPSEDLFPASALFPIGLVTGGAPFAFDFPVTFSTGSTSGAISLTNNGNYYAPTIIELPGPLVNPKIVNSTTGVQQELIMSIPTGELVTVDSLKRTITLGNYTAYAFMAASSDFIELAPGANTVSLLVESGTGTGAISFRDTWM